MQIPRVVEMGITPKTTTLVYYQLKKITSQEHITDAKSLSANFRRVAARTKPNKETTHVKNRPIDDAENVVVE